MNILHLEADRYPADSLERLASLGSIHTPACPSQEALLSRLREHSYHAIFTRLGLAIDDTVLDLQPDLRFVVTPTTGLNHIDLEEARRRGVEVISLQGEVEFLRGIRSTAEHTWALLLALMRQIPAAHQEVLGGSWERAHLVAGELSGKTLGILGHGRLGRMLVGFGTAFGMRVIAHDRRPEAFTDDGSAEPVTLEALLGTSDVLCVMISYAPENRHFLNRARLSRLKPGAVLVNTARGEVLDESALLEALASGRLSAAALDVLDGDSSWDGRVPGPHPLLEYARNHSNLILTPHMGGYAREAIERTRHFVVEKFVRTVEQEASAGVGWQAATT